MSLKAELDAFRHVPAFGACDPVHLQVLAFSATRVSFKAGEVLIKENQAGEAAYLILSGKAELSMQHGGPGGIASEGALLGDVAMIGGSSYALTATATEPVSALRIDRELFMRVAREFPDFASRVLQNLADGLGQSMAEITATRSEFEKARSFGSP